MHHPLCPEVLGGALAAQRWWPYRVLQHYPHMLKSDRELWEAWMHCAPEFARCCCYDTHLGGTWRTERVMTTQELLIAQGLHRHRCDVIAWDGEALWLIECKPESSPAAVGQVLCYSYWLDALDPQPVDIFPAILSWSHHPSLQQACDELGVALLQPTAQDEHMEETPA